MQFIPGDANKMAKQTVKYDSSTGKVYEELGAAGLGGPNAAVAGVTEGTVDSSNSTVGLRGATTIASSTSSSLDYYGHSTAAAAYQSCSYPYGQYMGSFGSPYCGPTSSQFSPYDR